MRLVAAAARFEADPQLVARLVCSCVSLAGVGLLSAVSRAANFARFASVPSSKRSMLLSLDIFSSRLRARAAFAIFRAILFAFLSSRVVSGLLPCSGVIPFPLRVADTFMLLFNSPQGHQKMQVRRRGLGEDGAARGRLQSHGVDSEWSGVCAWFCVSWIVLPV